MSVYMKKQQKGFTLIELMIVVAIIGILASLAMSAYQTYSIRTQVAEGINMAAGAKTPIMDAFNNTGQPPADRPEAGMSPNPADTKGSYVASVNVVNGRVDVVFGGRAHADIAGQTLSFTPYSPPNAQAVIWRCGAAAAPGGGSAPLTGGGVTAAHIVTAIAPRYLPAVCRP